MIKRDRKRFKKFVSDIENDNEFDFFERYSAQY